MLATVALGNTAAGLGAKVRNHTRAGAVGWRAWLLSHFKWPEEKPEYLVLVMAECTGLLAVEGEKK